MSIVSIKMMQLPEAFLIFCLMCICEGFRVCPSGCTISTNRDITNPQPLLLKPEGGLGNDAFFLPEYVDLVSFDDDQVIDLICGGNLRINGISMNTSTAQAVCTSGNLFTLLNQTVHFSAISCTRYPIHTARFSGNACLGKYREVEVGFEIRTQFIKLYTACFDDTVQTTVYTSMELSPIIRGVQVGFPRPSWAEGDFYNLEEEELNRLYMRNVQRITINALLGLDAESTKYIHQSNNFYLARGHLVPKVNFVYGAQQRATFYFINAAPHWQVFNGANWMVLERNYRDFVISQGINVTVFTGTVGVATLPHEITGEDTELYLYVDENNNKAIPVPRLFWKVLYEPATKAGVVFIGVNNPYDEDIEKYIICPDVCEQIDWLTWSPTIIERGYSYCCTVDDFRRAVDVLPDFEVNVFMK